MAELDTGLVVNSTTDTSIAAKIKAIIIKFWDCFCVKGVCRTILGYEFVIDTGAAPPVCCREPTYGPHEKSIIMNKYGIY